MTQVKQHPWFGNDIEAAARGGCARIGPLG